MFRRKLEFLLFTLFCFEGYKAWGNQSINIQMKECKKVQVSLLTRIVYELLVQLLAHGLDSWKSKRIFYSLILTQVSYPQIMSPTLNLSVESWEIDISNLFQNINTRLQPMSHNSNTRLMGWVLEIRKLIIITKHNHDISLWVVSWTHDSWVTTGPK